MTNEPSIALARARVAATQLKAFCSRQFRARLLPLWLRLGALVARVPMLAEQMRTVFVGAAIVTLIVATSTIVVSELTRSRVVFEPFDVPPDLLPMGYSREVAAQHLLDELNRLAGTPTTILPSSIAELTSAAGEWSRPDVIVPGAGSLEGLMAYLRQFLGYSNVTLVGGEILRDSDSYSLRLRVDDRVVGTVRSGHDALEQLFENGALALLRVLDPILFATHAINRGDQVRALRILGPFVVNSEGTENALRALNLQGLALYSCSAYEDAIAKYEAALQRDPDFAPAHHNLGDVHNATRAREEAAKSYAAAVAAVRRAPQRFNERGLAFAYLDWGLTLHAMKRYDGAIDKYRAALRAVPTFAVAYRDWGRALAEQGKQELAIERYRQALDLDPTLAIAYQDWGRALNRLGRHDEAVEKFAAATRLRPSFAGVYEDWAQTLEMLGKRDAANEVRRQAEQVRDSNQQPRQEPRCPW